MKLTIEGREIEFYPVTQKDIDLRISPYKTKKAYIQYLEDNLGVLEEWEKPLSAPDEETLINHFFDRSYWEYTNQYRTGDILFFES